MTSRLGSQAKALGSDRVRVLIVLCMMLAVAVAISVSADIDSAAQGFRMLLSS